MNIYLLYSITTLVLIALSFNFRKAEKTHPKMKFLWISSIIPLVMVLGSLLLDLCGPYVSHSLLYHLDSYLFWCALPGFILTGSAGPCTAGEPVRLCVSFIVSFMLYTFLIFIVIRISLYFKKKFWSGKALVPRQ
jgi:hypothetical protein